MSTTNTDYSWNWYVRNKGRRRYLGLVNNEGDDPGGAYDIEIFYDEIPDEYTSDDDTFTIPSQYELYVIKGVASELMSMDESMDSRKAIEYKMEFERGVYDALHDQIKESQQPCVLKPFDLRDDD